MTRQLCTSLKKGGGPCSQLAILGKVVCRFHSNDPADIAKRLEESRRGGERSPAPGSSVGPIAGEIEGLDLETAEGLRGYTAAAMRGLAKLPHSPKTASVMAQLVQAQRQNIERGLLEERMRAIEGALEEALRNPGALSEAALEALRDALPNVSDFT